MASVFSGAGILAPTTAQAEAILSEAVPHVTLYTTDQCSRCVSAKTLLARRGIAYEEINLAKDPDGRAELQERTGMFTFPQIVIEGATIGGFDELLAPARAIAAARAVLRRGARGLGWQCGQKYVPRPPTTIF